MGLTEVFIVAITAASAAIIAFYTMASLIPAVDREKGGRWRLLPLLIVTSAFGMAASHWMGHTKGLIWLSLIACTGWLIAFLAVHKKRTRRAERIRLDLPYFIDSLVLQIESGSSLLPAILESRRILPPMSPLVAAIERMEADLQCGLSQAEALEAMDRYLGRSSGTSAIGSIALSLRMGTPIGGVLREQSSRIREGLLLEGEYFANTLSIKLLIPLLFFI
ncbi:MAG: hypothetical protein JSV26_04130, partial [bacterium]